MLLRLAFLSFCSTLVVHASCAAQATLEQRASTSSAHSSTERFAFVGDLVQQEIDAGKLVGAVTWIWQDGNVIHHQAHGLRDRESDSTMKADTIFRIHSFTKAITTAAALMLWEEGKYQLDDPVEKFLPELANQQVYDPAGNQPLNRPLTVRDLMRHTSGVIYGNEKGEGLERMYGEAKLMEIDSSLDDFGKRLSKLPLAFSPGEQWRYGMSTDLLGRLVEVWSGQKFEEFLRNRVFTPLEMKDTDFFVPPGKLNRLATLYHAKQDQPLEADYGKTKGERNYVPSESPIRCSPGGGLFSTAHDYGTFLRMILAGGEFNGHRLLKPETVALMTSDQLPEGVPGVVFGEEQRDGFKFGLGFNVITTKSQWDPDAEIGEFGWGGAASCHYWVCPSKQLIVVTLEATQPYTRSLELLLKGKIYAAAGP